MSVNEEGRRQGVGAGGVTRKVLPLSRLRISLAGQLRPVPPTENSIYREDLCSLPHTLSSQAPAPGHFSELKGYFISCSALERNRKCTRYPLLRTTAGVRPFQSVCVQGDPSQQGDRHRTQLQRKLWGKPSTSSAFLLNVPPALLGHSSELAHPISIHFPEEPDFPTNH